MSTLRLMSKRTQRKPKKKKAENHVPILVLIDFCTSLGRAKRPKCDVKHVLNVTCNVLIITQVATYFLNTLVRGVSKPDFILTKTGDKTLHTHLAITLQIC